MVLIVKARGNHPSEQLGRPNMSQSAAAAPAKKPLNLKTKLAIGLLYMVLLVIVASPFIGRYTTKASNQGKVQALTTELAESKPTEQPFSEMATAIKIERVGVDVPVLPGGYNLQRNNWDLSADKVHLANVADPINNTGGFSVIYGHNNKNVLGKTKQLIKNDILVIFTTSGRKVYYAYDYDIEVKPEQVNILQDGRKANYVALMTCNGLFDQNRRLMYFRYVGYELQ